MKKIITNKRDDNMDDVIEKIKREKVRNMIAENNKIEIEVDDNNFETEVIERSKKVPVLVDFWAPWCMPCQMLGPTLSGVAKEYGGKFVLAKLNVDQNQASSVRYSVMSIPSVKLFADGRVVDEFVGVLPGDRVKQWLQRHITS